MADANSQIEISDNDGQSSGYDGTATTTVANVPSVSDKVISQTLIVSDDNNLEISLDNGTTYFKLDKGDSLVWDVKGYITQIKVRTSSGNADYRIMINYEEY